jgi:3-hydroxyacyl-[acyl-carrier-protein] dehydratase
MRLEFFEMIDTVEEIDYDLGTIKISAQLPDDGPVFEGHFPTFPILPGVMMLEIMNHATGYFLFTLHQRKKFVFLGGVKRAKFRRFVKPGTLVEANSTITHEGSGFCIAETNLKLDNGDVAADAEIVMIVSDFPTEELAVEMDRRTDLIKVIARSST